MSTAPTVQIQPLPPAPSSVSLLDKARPNLISQAWNQWILQLQQKVNVINATLADLGQVTLGPGGVLPISIGGTNADNAVEAFNNLSPLSTKGDMLIYDGGNTRLPIGTASQVVTVSPSTLLPVWADPAGGGGSGGTPMTTGELASISSYVLPVFLYFDDGNLMTV